MRILRRLKNRKLKAAAAALVMLLIFSGSAVTVFKPKPAQAQCVCGMLCTLQGSGIGRAINTVMQSQIVVEIVNTYSTLSNLYGNLTDGFNLSVTDALNTAENELNDYFEQYFAYDLIPMMQQRTRQRNVMIVDQTKTLNAFQDGQTANQARRQIESLEADAFVEARVSENTCVPASFGGGTNRARHITKYLKIAMPLQGLNAGGNVIPPHIAEQLQTLDPTYEEANAMFPGLGYYRAQFVGRGGQYCSEYVIEIDEDDYLTAAADGNALYQQARLFNYIQKYCNPDANNGVGCFGNTGSLMDYDILVDQTLFADDTIDFEAPGRLEAVNDLITNLVEPEVPDLIDPAVFGSAAAQEEFLGRRSFRARRVLAKKVIYDVAARRAPASRIGPFVETLRKAAGVELSDISDNPSLNEVVNALATERFWTGVYNLQNNKGPAQLDHEKLSVQAAELMHLSDYMDILSNISLIAATQVANETIELGDSGGIQNATVTNGGAE